MKEQSKWLQGILLILSLLLTPISWVNANNELLPILNKSAFDGFTITPTKTILHDYNYKDHDQKLITFKSCKDALDFNISDIAEHNYFRFKLLLVACKGINKYHTAQSSSQSLFPAKLDDQFYKDLPALTTSYLSKTKYTQRENKTIQQAYKSIKVTSKNNTATLITDDDEIYITVLARGDFNNDKIEDLLVTSEWYAKHAHGKHTELVVLSKTAQDKPVQIEWRMNTLKK
ncbi:MAG: hypothetical protein OQK95_06800 [Gammaproteobacteria bacterium]|nr:hypothetical protein [Gammaproteobacteria bacterium]